MRVALLAGMVACYALGLALVPVYAASLGRFLSEVPELRTRADMDRYKRVVAGQMVGALVQMAVLLLPWGLFGFGLMRGVLSVNDLLLFVVVPSVLLFVAGQAMKRLEGRAKTIPCADDLREERDRVVRTWMKKPLPDW